MAERRITGYYGDADETIEVAGHTTRCANVVTADGERIMFECVDCGLISNRVTGFNQHSCEPSEGGR